MVMATVTERKRAFNGSRLRALREKNNLTQEEMAAKLGQDQGQYWRYETGESEPRPYLVTRMAQELGVTTDYLLGVSDDPVPVINEDDLSLIERRLVDAFRRGDFQELMRVAGEKPVKT